MPQRIEVDDEVMAFLKREAEPFVDTPNSVLRRLLLKKGAAGHSGAVSAHPTSARKDGILPEVKRGAPKALEHILQVIYLTRNSGRTRAEATHEVARHHGVAFQTVLDKYGRQLDLTTDQFDHLLAEPDLSKLKRLLNNRFARHRDAIAGVLG